MSKLVLIILVLAVFATLVFTMITFSASESYLNQRDQLIAEDELNFGKNITLSGKEIQVNRILREMKISELSVGYKNSSDFLPSVHFFQAKERISKSPVFDFIRKIPKGASLHTHLLAAADVDFLIRNFTYRENLYGGYINDVFKLKFLKNAAQDNRTQWTSIHDLRNEKGPEVFDRWLHDQLVLTVDKPREEYPNVEAVWKKFKRIFTTTYDLFSFKPVFQDYVTRVLQELYDDRIMYTELKGTIMPLYDLDTTYSKEDFFETFIATVDEFKKKHDGFLGVKYILSVYRGVAQEVLRSSLDEVVKMKKLYPEFIAGFDFVGYEEEGNTLFDYRTQLLEVQNDLKFFFHAGETPWFGHTDLNLADAILLNSFRIGHGFSLVKHPKLLEVAKSRDIPLEICPISNQVLMLNDDPRNHPAAILMALNYPIVVGNDDPSVWNATGLSYDWYIVFMAMTPQNSGLEVLKQLAVNSIVYSTMEEDEKKKAVEEWERKWGEFLEEILRDYRHV